MLTSAHALLCDSGRPLQVHSGRPHAAGFRL